MSSLGNWTQPICDACWQARHGEHWYPVRLSKPHVETCAWCGKETRSGIYVRADPARLPGGQKK